MFSFFKKKPPAPDLPPPTPAAPSPPAPGAPVTPVVAAVAESPPAAAPAPPPTRRYGATSTFVAPPVPAFGTELIAETAERLGNDADSKSSWMARLKAGLSKTSSNLSLLFVGARIDEDLYEELEAALLMSDAGMDATDFLLTELRRKVKEDKLVDAAAVKAALKVLMTDMLRPLVKPLELGRHQPLVMMIAGVNGAGKTTTIGKLAKHMQKYEQSVLLAAGDTFRAAAREQLMVWGQRNNVTVIAQESGDPAAVAFDAVQSGKARKMDVVMVDTAGRLPTQLHLMEELKKIKRVIGKGMDGAPHEVLLVIDGNTGQNALAQVKAFDDALQLTGLVITKLDGTAKGGVLAAIARTRPIPVYFIGVGEKIEDLQPFSADEFVEALLG
ncbi:signal recognition particle-docking protein FtsY [Massilia genomosp. 1]|uniref:Signal recognition particle receptor FtsY n=1 Tax=Massilia genomosp. 1 TaxID=2609280 RepID=A0ABX0MNV4_9BURK|nr:signal recognition particle-docking protein FtsY [Massilia genomosp. 1]NHZ62091.1 signal recognition particle-docking protein FtsY [Massilia genomosp. 1]